MMLIQYGKSTKMDFPVQARFLVRNQALLDFSSLAVGAYHGKQLVGFVICLPPKTEYGSLNYAWFNQRYNEFLYVDRIAVATKYQNQKIGTHAL